MPKAILASDLGEKEHYSSVKPVFIYTLNCPITGNPRYVGQTQRLSRRMTEHRNTEENNHRGNLMRSYKVQGLEPEMVAVQTLSPGEDWQATERDWIQYFRYAGFDLVNDTDGGEGISGKKHSSETKAKISVAKLGKKNSPEHCAKISAAQIGIKHSPKRCAEKSAYQTGRKHSSETKVKMSAAHVGNKYAFGAKRSVETRAKLSNTARKRTPEHYAKAWITRRAKI